MLPPYEIGRCYKLDSSILGEVDTILHSLMEYSYTSPLETGYIGNTGSVTEAGVPRVDYSAVFTPIAYDQKNILLSVISSLVVTTHKQDYTNNTVMEDSAQTYSIRRPTISQFVMSRKNFAKYMKLSSIQTKQK